MPRGFGSYSALSTPGADTGFGAPTNTDHPGARGFGSPGILPHGLGIMFAGLEYDAYPDDGGEVVRLIGDWPSRGPYRVRVQLTAGGVLEPEGKPGCYSGLIGQGHLCYTDPLRQVLSFILPPLEPGEYTVHVYAGESAALGATVSVGGLTVVRRLHADEIYRARAVFPPTTYPAAGPRDWGLEDASLIPGGEMGPLRSITRMLGQIWQQTNGMPQTRLITTLAFGDTAASVETTLAFPSSGQIWIGGRKYAYNGKTATSFTGLTAVSSDDGTEIPPLTEVALDASALVPD